MSDGDSKTADFLRANAPGICVGLLLLAGIAFGVRWIASNRGAPPPPRKVVELRVVNVQPIPQPRVTPPPPPTTPPKVEEQEQTRRVELKAMDIPRDLPRPPSSESSGGGRLALAAEGEGPGDSFNLVGNPGGRGLLSGGGLGDGTGNGLGEGGAGNRFGWYYARIAAEIEEAFRSQKKMTAVSTRVELRVWADEAGRISRVQLVRSTGDSDLDRAIQSVVGLRLREPPPRDIPMPMVARLTARRPG